MLPQTGTIKFFRWDRGFGFICPSNAGPDIYLPAAAVERANIPDLKAGDEVSFQSRPDRFGNRGPVATEVKLLQAA